jgi:hypothetical protein
MVQFVDDNRDEFGVAADLRNVASGSINNYSPWYTAIVGPVMAVEYHHEEPEDTWTNQEDTWTNQEDTWRTMLTFFEKHQ